MKYHRFVMMLLMTLASASWLQAQSGVTLVSTGAVWKYLDDGTQPDATWIDGSFDDSGWLSGAAELGYGDTDQVTTVQSNRLDGTLIITTYFRHTFNIANPGVYSNVVVRLKRDDGAIVYLNGVEIFRSNMPEGPVDSLTLAAGTAADDGATFWPRLTQSPTLFTGPNVLAVEVHQVNTNSSDVSFDLALVGNFVPQAPTVTITAPTNNAVFFTPVNITINATATDPDDPITLVEFFDGPNKIGEDATFPYSLTVSNVPAGSYNVTARATDLGGASTDSAVVHVTVISSGDFLVSAGSTWRYLDDGSDQNASTFWTSPFYDDSWWPSGLAQLGFGDGDENALILSNRVDLTRITTYYFRYNFNLVDASFYTNLIVRLLRDDGAVVYLNDTEIFRSNMPTGEVNYLTLALAATPDESTFFQRGVNPALLVSGANTLAVEVHQNATDSSDISFDAALLANVPAGPPTVSITAPGNNTTFPPGNITINATASDPDGHVSLVEFFSNGTKVGQDATSPYSAVWTNPPPGNYALTARATDDRGNITTSAPVNITVVAGVTVTFQYTTSGGYTNMLDTDVRFNAPDTSFGTNNVMTVDGEVTAGGDVDPAHALLRFGDVFGSAPNQVPVAANIVLATLSFRTANGSVDTVSVHRVLIPWDESSTWNSLTDGISANDVEALAAADAVFQNNTVGNIVSVNVTTTVQAWANGAANWGWVLLPTANDGYQLNTSEIGTAAQRPTLTVTYAAQIRPRFSYQIVSGQLQLSWNNGAGYTLQQATSVTGPWTTAASQANPQLVSMTGPARFFRLSNP